MRKRSSSKSNLKVMPGNFFVDEWVISVFFSKPFTLFFHCRKIDSLPSSERIKMDFHLHSFPSWLLCF